MTTYVERAGLEVASTLATFIEREALPGVDIDAASFWRGVSDILRRFTPENRALLARRDLLQAGIDAWMETRRGGPIDVAEQESFLRSIGYLAPEPPPFAIDTRDLDDEIAHVAGPQLVVPVLNARFLLNAANARWGSLYNALYGTDAIPGVPAAGAYDPARGAQVIKRVKAFLDEMFPLADVGHAGVQAYAVERSALIPRLADPSQFAGFRGEPAAPDAILLRRHGLHVEIIIDRTHPVGGDDVAGVADVVLESALTTIADFEDYVATVDADDKVAAYANWLGLMLGNLEARFEKNGRALERSLSPDRHWTAPDGRSFTLSGRSLMLVRNVGLLMTTPAVRLGDSQEAPEGILDAIVTSLLALHDLKGRGRYRNSRTGSIYIVKPKLHGPEEAAFTDRLFDAVEDLLGLARHTIKIGVMDEERRTSANLAACIRAVRNRIFFINTGFLDRTGDEIHTSMRAGPMVRKAAMKETSWIKAYESRNVQIGLACGFAGKAQIGKGMWTAPDRMFDMIEQKIAHPRAGATTAWVPSPTAATLHAMHYHAVDVFDVQRTLTGRSAPPLSDLLAVPLAREPRWTADEISRELDQNAQAILGYVARWVDQGVGCSKVPDLDDVGLMEDRATLRISSQHIANWLMHGVCSPAQVEAALARMAAKVDAQNAHDPKHRPLAAEPQRGLAYQAARALIFDGARQPNGYTEPLLHAFRARAKEAYDR
jgi:malate synthase